MFTSVTTPVFGYAVRKGALYIGLCAVIVVVAGCAHHNHYRGYLMKATSSEVNGTSLDNKISFNDEYVPELYNAIRIPADTEFQLRLNELHLGYITPDNKRSLDKQVYEGLGGYELWVLLTAHTLHPSDPLQLDEKRFVKGTHVKVDQEGMAFIPFSDLESVMLTAKSDTSYRVVMKVYKVEAYAFKRTLAQVAGKGLLSNAFNTLKDAAEGTTNVLVKEVFDKAFERLGEPLAIERILLAADASIELMGTFDLNRDKQLPWPAEPMRFAIYDQERSNDPELKRGRTEAAARNADGITSLDQDTYQNRFIEFHSGKHELATEDEMRKAFGIVNKNEPDSCLIKQLNRSYIKFSIDPSTEKERAEYAALSEGGAKKVLSALEEERKKEKAQAKKKTADDIWTNLQKKLEELKANPAKARGTIELILDRQNGSDPAVRRLRELLDDFLPEDKSVTDVDSFAEAVKGIRKLTVQSELSNKFVQDVALEETLKKERATAREEMAATFLQVAKESENRRDPSEPISEKELQDNLELLPRELQSYIRKGCITFNKDADLSSDQQVTRLIINYTAPPASTTPDTAKTSASQEQEVKVEGTEHAPVPSIVQSSPAGQGVDSAGNSASIESVLERDNLDSASDYTVGMPPTSD